MESVRKQMVNVINAKMINSLGRNVRLHAQMVARMESVIKQMVNVKENAKMENGEKSARNLVQKVAIQRNVKNQMEHVLAKFLNSMERIVKISALLIVKLDATYLLVTAFYFNVNQEKQVKNVIKIVQKVVKKKVLVKVLQNVKLVMIQKNLEINVIRIVLKTVKEEFV